MAKDYKLIPVKRALLPDFRGLLCYLVVALNLYKLCYGTGRKRQIAAENGRLRQIAADCGSKGQAVAVT